MKKSALFLLLGALICVQLLVTPLFGKREMVKIFQAQSGEMVSPEYLTPGVEPFEWSGTPMRIAISRDGSLYLPAGRKVIILNREGRYTSELQLNVEMDVNCMEMKRFLGVDGNDQVLYYVPYFNTSDPFPNDYRHNVIAFNKQGVLSLALPLAPTIDPNESWMGQILADDRIFLQENKNHSGWLIDFTGKTTRANYQFFDALGNAYIYQRNWNDVINNSVNSVIVKSTVNDGKSNPSVDQSAVGLNQILEEGATSGKWCYPRWGGANRNGLVAFDIRTSLPPGFHNQPTYEFVLFDGQKNIVVEQDKYEWNTTSDYTPCVLFSQLDDDNSIIMGVIEPLSPWSVVPSEGGGPPLVFPSPAGQAFCIYRLK